MARCTYTWPNGTSSCPQCAVQENIVNWNGVPLCLGHAIDKVISQDKSPGDTQILVPYHVLLRIVVQLAEKVMSLESNLESHKSCRHPSEMD